MQAWGGRETSDITYADVQGVLTRLLIERGHLDEEWRGRQPYYYLEVKSTAGPARTPFYMSDGQYKRVSVIILVALLDRTRNSINLCSAFFVELCSSVLILLTCFALTMTQR